MHAKFSKKTKKFGTEVVLRAKRLKIFILKKKTVGPNNWHEASFYIKEQAHKKPWNLYLGLVYEISILKSFYYWCMHTNELYFKVLVKKLNFVFLSVKKWQKRTGNALNKPPSVLD